MANKNNVREFRQGKKLSKAELARLAGIWSLTVDRVEKRKVRHAAYNKTSSPNE